MVAVDMHVANNQYILQYKGLLQEANSVLVLKTLFDFFFFNFFILEIYPSYAFIFIFVWFKSTTSAIS